MAGLFACLAPTWGAYGGFLGIGLIYLLQQWILGFPDRHDLFLSAPQSTSARMDSAPNTLIGRTARSSTPLRLIGRITIDDASLEASSDSGFIPADTEVRIIAVKNRLLIVEPIEPS